MIKNLDKKNGCFLCGTFRSILGNNLSTPLLLHNLQNGGISEF